MYDQVSYITLETLQHNPPKLAFWGSLFSIGASLLGGLLSRPKKPAPAPAPQVVKVVETKQTPNIQEGVDAAKKAGFNPASAARMGLIQGFITNQTPFLTTNPDYVNWEANNNYQQQRSSWMGNMFSTIGSAANQWSNYQQNLKSFAQQSRLIDSEIYRNYSTGRQNYFKPAQWSGAQTEWHHAKNGSPIPLPDGWERGIPTVTNPIHPQVWEPNPYLADAEAWETRHGDIAQEIGGAINLVGDVAWNAYKYGSKVYDQGTKVYNSLLPHGVSGYGPYNSSRNNTLNKPNSGSGGGWTTDFKGGGW